MTLDRSLHLSEPLSLSFYKMRLVILTPQDDQPWVEECMKIPSLVLGTGVSLPFSRKNQAAPLFQGVYSVGRETKSMCTKDK